MPIERKKRTIEIVKVFKLLNHNPKKILDLGCGSGEITESLRKKGFNIIGLDVTEAGCEAAKHCYPNCNFQTEDINKQP